MLTNDSRLRRFELILLLIVCLIAAVLRCGHLDRLAVEHFDEGVYASNLFFPDSGFEYPERHLYAPPIVPALSEWSQLLFGGGYVVPLLPGLVLGLLTVPLVWWVSRFWFGPAAAIAAATAIAFSEFHIGLSRSALTDAPLLFFLVAGIGVAQRALCQFDLRLACMAGVLAGFAWATKYNGWLTLAIVVSGAGASWLFRSRAASRSNEVSKDAPGDLEFHWVELLSVMAVFIVSALCVWGFVLWDLQERGGYFAVAANHRNYVVGIHGWWSSCLRHEAIQRHFAGWSTWVGAIVAVVAAASLKQLDRSTWNEGGVQATPDVQGNLADDAKRSTWNGRVTVAAMFSTAALAGATVLSPLIVLIIWPITDWIASISGLRRKSSTSRRSAVWIGAWTGLAWMIGLLLTTPLYRPYPRLALPLMCAGWIGMGSAIVRLLDGQFAKQSGAPTSSTTRRAVWACLGVVLLVSVGRAAQHGLTIWQPRHELADAAKALIADVRKDCAGGLDVQGIKAVLYVYGEPSLLFHLTANDFAVQPIGDLAFARPGAKLTGLPTYLVYSRHAEASLQFLKEWGEVKQRFKLVTVAPYRSSEFVLLDDLAPNATDGHVAATARVLRLGEPRTE